MGFPGCRGGLCIIWMTVMFLAVHAESPVDGRGTYERCWIWCTRTYNPFNNGTVVLDIAALGLGETFNRLSVDAFSGDVVLGHTSRLEIRRFPAANLADESPASVTVDLDEQVASMTHDGGKLVVGGGSEVNEWILSPSVTKQVIKDYNLATKHVRAVAVDAAKDGDVFWIVHDTDTGADSLETADEAVVILPDASIAGSESIAFSLPWSLDDVSAEDGLYISDATLGLHYHERDIDHSTRAGELAVFAAAQRTTAVSTTIDFMATLPLNRVLMMHSTQQAQPLRVLDSTGTVLYDLVDIPLARGDMSVVRQSDDSVHVYILDEGSQRVWRLSTTGPYQDTVITVPLVVWFAGGVVVSFIVCISALVILRSIRRRPRVRHQYVPGKRSGRSKRSGGKRTGTSAAAAAAAAGGSRRKAPRGDGSAGSKRSARARKESVERHRRGSPDKHRRPSAERERRAESPAKRGDRSKHLGGDRHRRDRDRDGDRDEPKHIEVAKLPDHLAYGTLNPAMDSAEPVRIVPPTAVWSQRGDDLLQADMQSALTLETPAPSAPADDDHQASGAGINDDDLVSAITLDPPTPSPSDKH